MTEKRFKYIMFDGFEDNGKEMSPQEVEETLNRFQELSMEDYKKIKQLEKENKELKFQLKECREHKLYSRRKLEEENKKLKDKYERKDRQLKRTKKDIEKYTDYFMNELNWDCDRIIKEVFR